MNPPASPDSETFSTPPTTPSVVSRTNPPLTLTVAVPVPAASAATVPTSHHSHHSNNNNNIIIQPQRRGSARPQNLLINPAIGAVNDRIGSDIVLQRTPDGEATLLIPIAHSNSVPDIQEQSVSRPRTQQSNMYGALNSPCFVHSHLERGASLKDWLTQQQLANANVGVSKSINPATFPSTVKEVEDDVDIELDYANSLTRQLAETAIGVREMNKALSRARVHSNLSSILIITKARDNRLVQLTRDLAIYLMGKQRPHGGDKRLIVYVDAQLRYSKRFDPDGIRAECPEFFAPLPRRGSSSSSVVSMHSERSSSEPKDEGQLRYWTSDMCSRSPHLFDFVVTLGGDGTVLFTSWLFQRIVPPVLPFALGSLGFLTNFDFSDYKPVMDAAIDNGIRVNLRMRFTCTVYRAIAEKETKKRKAVKKGITGEILMKDLERGGWEALEGGYPQTPAAHGGKDKEIKCFTTRPVETFEILNDLVVDRGPSPYVSLLELFGDEHHMTTVQADGLVIATPTGSTAYSLSAGGSLVHPEIPAILISPICPHTLSFRPMLLPDTMELRICVPFNSRSTAWASFDGRGRVELKQGDHIKVTASKYPFPTVCADKQSTDWFHAISRTLKWNERERQKSFVVVEEGPAKEREKRERTPVRHEVNGTGNGNGNGNGISPFENSPPTKHNEVENDEDEDEDEDEDADGASDEEGQEDDFDITDSSPEGAAAAAKRAEARATSSEESSPPESSRSSSVGGTTTSTYAGAGAGPRIADLGNEQYRMPITTTPHPDTPAYDEALAAAKAIKGRKEDTMRTPRAQTHQRLATPPLPPQVPHSHSHHHQHHPHLTYTHGVGTPSGLRHEFTPPAPARTHSHSRHHASSRSADFDAGTHRRAFAVWGQDESSDDNSP